MKIKGTIFIVSTRSSAIADKPPDAMLLRRRSGNSLIGGKGGYFLCPVSAIPACDRRTGAKMAAFSTFWFSLDTPWDNVHKCYMDGKWIRCL